MGGWTFVEPRLRTLLPPNATLIYVGRAASASPATGSYAIHNLEQAQLVNGSLSIDTSSTSAATCCSTPTLNGPRTLLISPIHSGAPMM